MGLYRSFWHKKSNILIELWRELKGIAFQDRYGILPTDAISIIGRKKIGAGDSYQLREPAAPYSVHFECKKDDIGPKNTWLWDV